MSPLDIAWRNPTTCWTAESAREILPVEAEAIPVALFQQAHVPLRLKQVNPQNVAPVTEALVTERDVLNLVKDRVGGSIRRTDIIPVLGRAGAGKSHLVRWLRNEFRREPTQDLRTVFIPKHRTSLRGVVELLLNAFSDVEELAPIRDELQRATDTDRSREQLRTAIRDRLCEGVEFQTDRTSVSQGEKESRDFLATALPALLRDPHFAPQHLADGSAIARLVSEKLDGREADDAVEIAFQFTKEDLQTSADDVGRAAADARAAVQYLMQDPPADPSGEGRSLSELAAAMLNDQLPSAIKDVFGVGGEDLKQLLARARSILHDREDVLLLIEDFAMFQGLQQGLVDAITLHDTENERLCALVTVFAVTTGYYSDYLPQTLKTRASTAYEVGEQGGDAPVRFAASYLRAIRLGMPEVEARHERDARGPSSCEGCDVVEICHEAFGELDGEGLFPFNRTMLNRATAATSDHGFNARVFLNWVLRPALVEDHRDIERQQYPSEEAAKRFDARAHRPSGSQLLAVESADDGDRRARLALLYKPIVDSGDLASAIHAAFGLPPLGFGGEGSSESEESPKQEEAPKAKAAHQGREAVPSLVEQLAKWARTGGMSQRARRETRQLVGNAVLDRVTFNDAGFKKSAWTRKPGPFFKVTESVVLDDDVGVLDSEAVRLNLQSKDPLDVDALQSLAWLDQEGSWDRVPDGHERAARVEVALDRWVDDVTESLGLRRPSAELLSLAAEAMEAAHALTGTVAADLADRAELMITQPELDGYVDEVTKAVNTIGDVLARSVAYARGEAGGVAAVDWPLAEHVLLEGTGGNRLLSLVGEAPPDGPVGPALQVVAKRLAEIDRSLSDARRLVPDLSALGSETPVTLAEDLIEVATGHVQHQRLADLRRAAEEVLESDPATVSDAAEQFESWDALSPIQRAALVNGTWRPAARRIGTFLTLIESVLDAATPTGTTLGGNDRAEVVTRWETAVATLARLLDQAQEEWG